MKKVITIVMIMCIMLCGCDKTDTPTAKAPDSTTTTPTKEPTQEPTKEQSTPEPTKEETSNDTTPTISAEELIEEINAEIDESQMNTTIANYDSMYIAANIALANPDVLDETFKLGDGYIKMSPDGITFENISPALQNEIANFLGDLSELKFYQKCSIKINANATTTREQQPGK